MTATDEQYPSQPVIKLLMVFIAMSLTMLAMAASAQSSLLSTTAVTPEILENRIKEAETASDLDEASKSKLLELYRRSSNLIAQRRDFETAAKKFARARESAPEQARLLRVEMEVEEAEFFPLPLPRELQFKPLPELEQQLLGEKANLSALSGRLEDLETVLESQTQRSTQAREHLTRAKTREANVNDELRIPVPQGQLPLLSEALRWALELELLTLGAEVNMLDQELLSQPMRIELLGAQRDKTTLEVKRLLEKIEQLENLTADKRRSEASTAKQAADESQRQAFGKHSLVQSLAERNAQLGETLNRLAKSLEQITIEVNASSEQVKLISDSFRLTRQKLRIAGLGQALGQVMLEQNRGLPNATQFRKAKRLMERSVVDSSLRQILHQRERDRLRDLASYVENLLVDDPFASQLRLRAELMALAEARRKLLDKAIAADEIYLQALGEFDFAQRQLLETVTAYQQFLDERLLWVRSGEPPTWDTLKSIPQTLSIFLSNENWQSFAQALVVPGSSIWILIIGILLFALLSIKAKRFRAELRNSSNSVGQLRHDRFSDTFKALGWTLLLTFRWPLLFITIGLHLLSIDTGSVVSGLALAQGAKGQFAPAVGYALYRVGLFVFFFEVIYEFCKPYGLLVAHFRWHVSSTNLLAREMRRMQMISLPAGFILVATIIYDPPALVGGLSRLCVVIIMAALAWFLGRILAPSSGVPRYYYDTHPRSPLTWFRYLWVVLAFILPVVLAGLAMAGYVYTAIRFGELIFNTLLLIFAIIVIHQFIVRGVLLTERRLAFRAALEKHRLQRAAREAAEGESSAVDSEQLPLEEQEIDFGALGEDTTKLINTILTLGAAVALWAIWADVLPAFHVFNEISLWHYQVLVEGAEKLVPVTLNDFILVLLIVIFGVIAVRRLPALLEFVLLARLNITAGSRYAITTLTQYAIITVGLVFVFSLLGGSWSEIQWLIAALGVGIGFGLQDIVANFISGLILLFERPVRIGDVVTVGETDGIVTRIRMRSTTIRTWDQKELIVPNKEFVTGRLLNWTLSDPVTRIVIPVGIAYGSDVATAIQLVQEAAEQHERVLEDPPILVTFENFGDSTLTIMLRCFIGSMDYFMPTTSELNQSINSKFNEAGIVFAFPQRDIHLDTSQPLEIRLHRVPGASEKAVEPGQK